MKEADQVGVYVTEEGSLSIVVHKPFTWIRVFRITSVLLHPSADDDTQLAPRPCDLHPEEQGQ